MYPAIRGNSRKEGDHVERIGGQRRFGQNENRRNGQRTHGTIRLAAIVTTSAHRLPVCVPTAIGSLGPVRTYTSLLLLISVMQTIVSATSPWSVWTIVAAVASAGVSLVALHAVRSRPATLPWVWILLLVGQFTLYFVVNQWVEASKPIGGPGAARISAGRGRDAPCVTCVEEPFARGACGHDDDDIPAHAAKPRSRLQ